MWIRTEVDLFIFSSTAKLLLKFSAGVAQGVVTGIRGLCNGLGPALFGFIFYLFHVDLNEKEILQPTTNRHDNLSHHSTHGAIQVSYPKSIICIAVSSRAVHL